MLEKAIDCVALKDRLLQSTKGFCCCDKKKEQRQFCKDPPSVVERMGAKTSAMINKM